MKPPFLRSDPVHQNCEVEEASLFLRWAALNLNDTEQLALCGYSADATQAETARACGLTRSAIWFAQRSGFRKMRRSLLAIGIRSSRDLFSGGA